MKRAPLLALGALLVVGVTGLYSWLSPPPGPPPLAVEVDGTTQVGGLGSFCWTTWGRRACSDAAGPVTAEEPLLTTSPLLASLHIPAEGATELVMDVFPIAPEDELELDAFGKKMWRVTDRAREASQRHHLSGQDAPHVELHLEPGLYVLNVFVNWDGQRDSSHGFLVEVRAGI